MIDLSKVAHTKLPTNINGELPKYWIENNGVKYLFKDNYRSKSILKDISINSQTNWGEVLYSKLCTKLNVPCVSTAFAIGEINGKHSEGVLVKSYLTDDVVEQLNYDDIVEICFRHLPLLNYYGDVESCVKLVSRVARKTNLKINPLEIRKQLVKQTVVDYFFGQVDRHYRNIEFLVRQDKQMKIAPMFDNGNCFAFHYGIEEIGDYKKELSSLANDNSIIGDMGIFFLKPVKDSDFLDYKNTAKLIKDIYVEYKGDEDIRNLVDNILSLDIVQEINQLEKSGGNLLEEYKDCAEMIFENRKNLFLQYEKRATMSNQTSLDKYCAQECMIQQ